MQSLRLHAEVQAVLRVQARQEDPVNSLDPRNKRFRAADRSLQQARNALNGAVLALQDLPRSNLSAATAALASISDALADLDAASAHIDEARMEAADENLD
jgi:hypothetical protein